MGSEWTSTPLSQIVNIHTGKLDSNRADENGCYPFFTCAPEPLRINEFAYDEDAILLAGNNANGVFHVNRYKGKFNAYQRTYIITAKEENYVSLDFIYYNLKTLGGIFESLSLGTATKFLTMKILSPFEIKLPSLEIQKSIAHILGSLDDKIELNRQMNTTLESMAQALFKSWFVDFDPVIDNALATGNSIPEPFQARAKTRHKSAGQRIWTPDEGARRASTRDGASQPLGDKRKPLPEAIQKQFPNRFVFTEEIGWIPEGWEVTSIYDFVDVIYGAPFKSEGFNPEAIGEPIIRIRDLKTGTPQCWSEEIHPKGTLIRSGDIAVGMDAEFRATIWFGENGYLNQRLFTVKPKMDNLNSFFLQSSLGPPLAIEENAQVGTTVAHLGKKDIDKFRLLKPSGSVLALYNLATGTELKQWVNLHAERSTLTNLRDLLLPKLLSGQLRIPEAETLVADAL